VAAWLEAHAPRQGSPQDFTIGRDREFVAGCRRWQAALFEGGWAGISWPTECGGRGLSALFDLAFRREQARFGVSTAAFDVGIGMVGPTLMVHGTAEQKASHLPGLLRGQQVWCLVSDVQRTGGGIGPGRALDRRPAQFGITVPGVPNFFMLYGPNTNGGEIIHQLETQADYAVGVIQRMLATGAEWMEPSPRATAAWNRYVQKAIEGTSWQLSNNYYKAASGRNVTQWPNTASVYRLLVKVFGRASEVRGRRGERP
jgi:hypothetical protein